MAIRVELELDDGSFTTRMLHAGESVQQFQRNVGATITSVDALQRTNQSFIGTLRDVTVTLGLAGAAIGTIRAVTTSWVGDIAKVNGEFERLTTLLKGMSKASDPLREATDQVRQLRDFARQTPYSLQGLTDVFTKLKSGGIDPMSGSMKGLVNAVASFGGSEEVLKRASLAMQQMSGKGVIQMEELRQQLGEAVPRAADLLARSMGVTQAELVKAISTGTVEAKRSLELLGAQFDLVFGGAAAAQMNTFNGLMVQLQNSFQNLQLKAGEAGFFNALKTQMRSLNEALSSRAAEGIATSVGNGLTTAIGVIDRAIRVVINFKTEIIDVAKWVGIAFGGKIVLDAFLGFTSSLGTAGAALTAWRMQMATATEAWTVYRAGAVAGVASTAGFTTSLAIARTAIYATATALTTLAPLIMLATGAFVLLGDRFDVLGKKAKEARKEVGELGAEASKESLKTFVKDVQAREAELDKLKGKRDYYNRISSGNHMVVSGDEKYGADIAAKENALTADRQRLATISADWAKKEAERATRAWMESFEEQQQSAARMIDLFQSQREKDQSKQLADLTKQGKSTQTLQKAYAEETRQIDLDTIGMKIANAENERDVAIKAYEDATGAQKEELGKRMDALKGYIEQQKMAYDGLKSQPLGIPTLPKLIDEDKLYKKGSDALQRLKDDTAGLRAELQGGNREVNELYASLMAGKYGPGGLDATEKVKELIDALIKAQAEKSRLDELVEGKSKFDKDGAALELKLQQEIFEEQTRGMSEVDKWKAKINSGFYNGIGPGSNPLVQQITAVNDGFTTAQTAGESLATTIQTKLFGQETLSGGNNLVSVLKKAVEQIRLMKEGVAGINDAAAGIAPTPGVTSSSLNGGNIRPSGVTAGSDGYLGRLIKQESGGKNDAAASSSSAVGLGQFIESTWLKFLKDMHPDQLESLTRQQALDLRKNSDLMKEAILWYARENSAVLQKAGIAVNDANLYLAHFLGPQGAVNALSKSNDTPLSAVGIDSQIASNPFLRGKDVGWLKNWSNRIMGGGSTVDPVQANDSRLPTPKGLNPEQGAQVDRVTDLEKRLNALKVDNALADKVKELNSELKKTGDEATGTGSKLAKIDQAIRDGVFGKGPGQEDPMSERYKAVRAEAEKLDAAEKVLAENRKLRSRVTAAAERNKTLKDDLDFKQEDIDRRIKDQNPLKLSESLYRLRAGQTRDEMAGESLIKRGDSNWSAAQQEALVASNAEAFKRSKDIEVQENLISEQKKNRDIERELMTADQRRQASHDEEIARLRALVAETQEGTAARAQAEEALARRQILARKQVEQQSPLGKQMKEWSSLGENMEKAMTGWLDSGVDAMAEFVTTGKADFASLFQSIAKDITKLALKWALSSMFGGQGGAGGGLKSLMGGGGGGGAAKGAAGGGAKMFGAMHTGGIVGAGFSMSRTVSPGVFSGAPRFHTGGIIGADEVPIIAQRGEGVFTSAQMAAMGGAAGNKVVTIAPTIQVNASGGTPAQNADLAAQTAKAAEGVIRSIVVDELMTQTRPGNMFAR